MSRTRSVRNIYTGVIGKVGSYALLLGTLALPATAISQTNPANSDSGFAPSVQQPPPMGHGTGGYGMPPAWGSRSNTAGAEPAGVAPAPAMGGVMGETMGRAMSGFMGHMQQPGGYAPGYGPGMGYGPYGASPFDNAPLDGTTVPRQQPSSGPVAGKGAHGAGYRAPTHTPPMPGMGPSPDQAVGGNPAMPSNAGRGMFPQGPLPRAAGSCGRGHFMCGARGYGGMGQGGMRTGADISRLLQIPGLSDEQREKIYDILDDLRRTHWKLMGNNMDHAAELRGLYGAKRLDAEAIGAVYGKIFDIKRKMIETGIEAKQQARDVLTDEQREQLQGWGRPAF